jgi:hypothetical protein
MPAKNRDKFGRVFSGSLRRKRSNRPRVDCSAGSQGTEATTFVMDVAAKICIDFEKFTDTG